MIRWTCSTPRPRGRTESLGSSRSSRSIISDILDLDPTPGSITIPVIRKLVKASAGRGPKRGASDIGGDDVNNSGAAFGTDFGTGRMVIDEEDRPWIEKVGGRVNV